MIEKEKRERNEGKGRGEAVGGVRGGARGGARSIWSQKKKTNSLLNQFYFQIS